MKKRGSFNLEFSPQFNGTPCPYVVVEGPLAKRVAGLSLIRQDIQAAREIFSRIAPHPTDSVGNRALLFGALALYGKCFTQANGRGVKLEAKKIFDSPEIRESHDRIMQLRNEYAAHGGNAPEEQLKIILLLDPDRNKKRLYGLIGHGVTAHGFDDQARNECMETAEIVCSYVEDNLDQAQEALWNAIQEQGEDWAYQNAIWPESVAGSF